MVYGILVGNKLHLSEIVRSLKENIILKKTIDQLSINLNAFDGKDAIMQNYLRFVRRQAKDDYAVTIVDNSDIAKPVSRKLETLSEIQDGSMGEFAKGCLTSEAAALSEKGKMLFPVCEKVFYAAEKGFISETDEDSIFLAERDTGVFQKDLRDAKIHFLCCRLCIGTRPVHEPNRHNWLPAAKSQITADNPV